MELARGARTRVTRDEALDGNAIWHPDGRRLVFTSHRNGQPERFWQAADGSGTAERVLRIAGATDIVPHDWSPDGATLFVVAVLPETGADVGMVSFEGSGTWEPLLQTPADEMTPTLSPNGRWLAHGSDETGHGEVYVRRYPELDGQTPISLGRADGPLWSPDGRELFFLRAPVGPLDAVMRVPIGIDEAAPRVPVAGPAKRVFDVVWGGQLGAHRSYDVTSDGQRFLMIRAVRPGRSGSDPLWSEIRVVLDWHRELLERVPVP